MQQPHHQQRSPAKGKTYDLVPPDATRRTFVACRFPEGAPAFSSKQPLVLAPDKRAAARQQQRDAGSKGSSGQAAAAAASSLPPELLLSSAKQQAVAAAGGGGGVKLHGAPRTDHSSGNYFLLTQSSARKGMFEVHPVQCLYTFKKAAASTGPQTVDELEAAMAAAAAAAGGGGGIGAALLPASLRRQMAEQRASEAAERQLKEDVAPLLKASKVAELVVRYGAPGGGGGASQPRSKLVMGASDDEHSDEGLEDDDEDASASAAARRRALNRKAAAAGKGGKRGGKAGALDIPEHELAEDIYAGEEDELRPAAPTEDVDWEFQDEAADDDLQQGASDEEGLDDDPGLRKKLGIDPTDEEAEEDAKRQAGLAAEPEAADGAAAAAAAASDGGGSKQPPDGQAASPATATAAGGGAAGRGTPVSMDTGGSDGLAFDDDEVEDFDDEGEFDDDALDALAESVVSHLPSQAKRRRGSAEPGGRERSPAPAYAAAAAAGRPRGNTPPAGAGARATPPLGSSGRRGSTPKLAAGARRTPPPLGGAAAAAGGSGGASQRTPPAGNKRKRDGSAGTPRPPAAAAAAPDADGSQGLTPAAIRAVLQEMGPVPLNQIAALLQRLGAVNVPDSVKNDIKGRMLRVAKVETIGGVKYIVAAQQQQ